MKLLKFDSLGTMKSLNFINVCNEEFNRLLKFVPYSLVISLFLVSCSQKELKTGYIDLNRINKEYKLAIALEAQIRALENDVASQLLGMQADVNLMQDSIKTMQTNGTEPAQEFLINYYNLNKEYEKQKQTQLASIQDSVVKYREELISNINQLVQEYARKEQYHYVFSPAGSGAFMYGDSTLNITKEVIAYLNAK